eukprot:2579906-Amphidinium_carterae.1
MSARMEDAIKTLHVLKGRNPAVDASREEVYDSARRYQGSAYQQKMSHAELKELANVIREAAPEEYSGYRVKTPEE